MTTVPRAADLPAGSVVVDDHARVAWYARPSRHWRWSGDGDAWRSDQDVDDMLAAGATVLRVGTGQEQP